MATGQTDGVGFCDFKEFSLSSLGAASELVRSMTDLEDGVPSAIRTKMDKTTPPLQQGWLLPPPLHLHSN